MKRDFVALKQIVKMYVLLTSIRYDLKKTDLGQLFEIIGCRVRHPMISN